MSPFIMNPEGMARLFAVDKMAEGAVPGALRAVRESAREEPDARAGGREHEPRRAHLRARQGALGTSDKFPYAATTYRLTEHLLVEHVQMLAVPARSRSSSWRSARSSRRRKGIRNGEKIRVRSNRGEIVAKAVVTKRIKPLVAGKTIHTVGIPIHWGFEGLTQTWVPRQHAHTVRR